jgi:hypothetical protein
MPTKSRSEKKPASAKRRKARPITQKQPEQPPPPPPVTDWQGFLTSYISNAAEAVEGPAGKNQSAITLEALQKQATLEQAVSCNSPWQVVNALLTAAYVQSTSPMKVAEWLSSETELDEEIIAHLNRTLPSTWRISLLELLAQTAEPYTYYEKLFWHGRFDEHHKMLQEFVSGPIKAKGHSPELYRMLYSMFLGASVITSRFDVADDEKAPLMQGIIAMAKKGIFLKDFETFLPKRKED